MARAKQPQKFVIPVMGPTGAGKSTFINSLLGENRMVVGETLKSQTTELAAVSLKTARHANALEGYQMVVVDTPGFDDSVRSDVAILRKIAEWLEKSYKEDKAILGGVIYLHDVSLDRFTGTAQRNLDIFQALCGDEALPKVVIGTTKWERIKPEIAQRHEDELRRDHWKALIEKGAKVASFKIHGNQESAWEFINTITTSFKERTDGQRLQNLQGAYLQIQKELGDLRKLIPETEAGKTLRAGLKELLDMEKQVAGLEATMARTGQDTEASKRLQQAEEEVARLKKQIQQLKVPFSRRLRKLFGLG